MKAYFAEALGTFFLVFAGTTAIVVNDATHGLTHLGVSLTFGLVVMVLIYALGDISGAHFNPVVTLGFWLAKRLAFAKVIPYILFQTAGAFAASMLVKCLFPTHPTLGATLPAGTAYHALIVEIIITTLLVLVILNVTAGSKEKGLLAGIAIGGTVGLAALFAGPISGASMNPARSLAPALISNHLGSLWIYGVGPIVGAVIAVWLHRLLREH